MIPGVPELPIIGPWLRKLSTKRKPDKGENMSKRRTIGENPLDAVVSRNPLDAVVPDPLTSKPGRPALEEHASDERMEQLEAAIKALRMQVAEVRMEIADLKNQMFRDSYLLAQVKDKLAGK
jgi:hypothetical protein